MLNQSPLCVLTSMMTLTTLGWSNFKMNSPSDLNGAIQKLAPGPVDGPTSGMLQLKEFLTENTSDQTSPDMTSG